MDLLCSSMVSVWRERRCWSVFST